MRRWLGLAVACLTSLGAAACSGSCSDQPKPKPKSPAKPGDPRVTVQSRGGDPKITLQVGRWTGLRYTWVIENEGTFGVLGQAQAKLPKTVGTINFKVTRGTADPVFRDRDGTRIQLVQESATLSEVRIESASIPPEVLTELNKLMALFAGTRTKQLVADDGEIVELTTELLGGKKPPEEIAVALDNVWDIQRRFPFRMPPGAVGVGAKWRFTETVKANGVRAVQLADMKLEAINQERVKIRIRVRQHAPRQELKHPEKKDGQVMLEQYRGDGDGHMLIDRLTGVVVEARLATTAKLVVSDKTAAPDKQKTTFMAANMMSARGSFPKAPADGGADAAADAASDAGAAGSAATPPASISAPTPSASSRTP